MTIYLSGQVLGLPISIMAEIYEAAAAKIRASGHTPINPLDEGKESLIRLENCDALYLLHNYRNSIYSLTDEANAAGLGLKIFYEDKPAEFWEFIAEYEERGRVALINQLDQDLW